jgi:uncharacterized protein
MYTIQLNSRLQERLTITPEELYHFCQRWQVSELVLFGSIMRDDFHAGSDIDVLVSSQPAAILTMLWRQVPSVHELTQMLQKENL